MSWAPFPQDFERKVICPGKFSVVGAHHTPRSRPQFPPAPALPTSCCCDKTLTRAEYMRKAFPVLQSWSGREAWRWRRQAMCSHCICTREAGSEQKMKPGCKPLAPRATSSSKAPPHKRSITFQITPQLGTMCSKTRAYGRH